MDNIEIFRWVDIQIDGWMEKHLNESIYGWMDGWMDELYKDIQMGGYSDGRMKIN